MGDGMQQGSTYHRQSLGADREFGRLLGWCSSERSALVECQRNSDQSDPGRSSERVTCNTPENK